MTKSTILWLCIIVGAAVWVLVTIARGYALKGDKGLDAIAKLGLVAFGAGLIGYFLTQ